MTQTQTFTAAESLWYPPVPEGFGPWVEWDESMPPPRDERRGSVQILMAEERSRETFQFEPNSGYGDGVGWGSSRGATWAIVAYCLKLSTPAEPQQAAAPQPALTQAELGEIFECFEGLSDQPTPKAPDGFDHIRAKYDFSRFRA